MKLALGVLDVAYSDAHGKKGATTTGEVAEILEDRYGVMETFFEEKKQQIADALAEQLVKQIAQVSSGGPQPNDAFAGAEGQIDHMFRRFLDDEEMARIAGGLSEGEAARFRDFRGAGSRGVSHRKKQPYSSKNEARAAFIDTGLYQLSFRAKVKS